MRELMRIPSSATAAVRPQATQTTMPLYTDTFIFQFICILYVYIYIMCNCIKWEKSWLLCKFVEAKWTHNNGQQRGKRSRHTAREETRSPTRAYLHGVWSPFIACIFSLRTFFFYQYIYLLYISLFLFLYVYIYIFLQI